MEEKQTLYLLTLTNYPTGREGGTAPFLHQNDCDGCPYNY